MRRLLTFLLNPSNRPKAIRRTLAFMLGCSLIPWVAFGQTETKDITGIQSVRVGLESTARLGKWLPVNIEMDPTSNLVPAEAEISALDGNGTKVRYRGLLTKIAPNHYQTWTRIGRTYGKLGLRLFDSSGEVICEAQFDVRNVTNLEPATVKHLLLIGGNGELKNQLDSTFENLYDESTAEVLQLSDARQLPTRWFGYDGINSVLLCTADESQINSISSEQWSALDAWVNRGGRLLISTNGTGGRLATDQPFSRFLVGEFVGSKKMTSMVRLDNFTKTRLDAKELEIAELKVSDGKVEIVYDGSPLLVRQSHGMGQIVFVAFDIADPVLADWKGRSTMLSQLIQARVAEDSTRSTESSGSRVSHQGFTDLSGQLRIPLEKFGNAKLVSFTLVAVLIGLFILCVGPGDFFLLKKFAPKMEMTWVTFSLATLGFCGLAFFLHNWSRPNAVQINQLEIIDIDSQSRMVRGNTWTNIYSPSTGKHAVDLDTTMDAIGLSKTDCLLTWLGVPGDGLGGMQTKAGLSTGKQGYQTTLTNEASGLTSSRLEEFPLQVSSTQGLHAEWFGHCDSRVESNLSFSKGRLLGQITNPFPFELTNVRIMFGNYTYILDKTLAANATIDLGAETRERTGKSYLTRRTKSGERDRGQNMPWDPTSSRLDRIADMMMFYRIAGGKDYTSLTHDFQHRIELSDHVQYGRAIFVAEVDAKTSQLTLDGKSSGENYDNQLTIFRILLPVEQL